MKTLDELWQTHLDRDLSSKELKDLAWHIENDEDPQDAISLTADMGLKQLGPVMAKQLDNPDNFIRQWTIGCLLGQLGLSDYAEKGFEMAQYDEDESVRNMAIFNLGAVVNKVSFPLAKKIATYIIEVFQHHEDKIDRDAAYFSILKAMEVPHEKRPRVSRGVKLEQIDQSVLEAFCKKYQASLGGALGGSKNA